MARNLCEWRPYNSVSASYRWREMSFISASSEGAAAPALSRVSITDVLVFGIERGRATPKASEVFLKHSTSLDRRCRKSAEFPDRPTDAVLSRNLQSDNATHVCHWQSDGLPLDVR